MSGFEDNFFDDDAVDNPFNDAAVQQITNNTQNIGSSIDNYDPYQNPQNAPRSAAPATMAPTTQEYSRNPPQYNKSAQQTQRDLDEFKRQREAEDRVPTMTREDEIRSLPYNARKNNWPPVPESCCVQPCFYQDINIEIRIEFQRIVRHLYYLWLFHGCILILNVIGGLALLIAFADFTTFSVGILYVILFTPFSFLCWYRPVYKAFRDDSSFNFMVFFFVFFFQFVVTVILAIGLPGSGTCGILKAISCFDGSAGGIVVGLITLVVAFGFIGLAAGEILLLSKVHTIYRSSGASFAKAQQEFTSEVMRNPHVQEVASNAAGAAVRSQMTQQSNRR